MNKDIAQNLAERILNLSDVSGCGIIDATSGAEIVYVGDFLETDWENTDLWGSLSIVVVEKLSQKLVSSMIRDNTYKTVIFKIENAYIGAKIPRDVQAWHVAARMEPLIIAVGL